MIERLENRRLLSATPAPVVTTTTSTVQIPTPTILPDGSVIVPTDATGAVVPTTITTTDTVVVVTNKSGVKTTADLKTISSSLVYTDASGNEFSSTGTSTELIVTTAGSTAKFDATTTHATFSENGAMYVTIDRSSLIVEGNASNILTNFSDVSVTGPDAATILAAIPSL